MKNRYKLLVFGIAGGMLPVIIYFLFGSPLSSNNDGPGKSHLNRSTSQKTNLGTKTDDFAKSFIAASESSVNSVVHVTTLTEKTISQRDPILDFFYGPGAGEKEHKQFGFGFGSGVIVSSDGYIVTNSHVIDYAREIRVVLNDKREYVAKVIGVDKSTDLAVLKIKEKNLAAIPVGNSDDLRIGQWVIAVGNPFNLTSTVTAGIISAKARNIKFPANKSDNNPVPLESFIQTDAALNPGNSGGALVNTKGELVGINAAIASPTGSYSGYSFAIPINTAQKVINDLIVYGIVQRGYLGIQMQDITEELINEEKLVDGKGVFIRQVFKKGSADRAGIKSGYVILKIDGNSTDSMAKVQEEIGKRSPGDKILLTVRNKKGDILVKKITLRNHKGGTGLVSKGNGPLENE